MIGTRKKKDTEANKDITKQNQPVLVGFRAVYVFDVSQTEGAELPAFIERTRGEVGEFRERLIDFTIAQGTLSHVSSVTPASRSPQQSNSACSLTPSRRKPSSNVPPPVSALLPGQCAHPVRSHSRAFALRPATPAGQPPRIWLSALPPALRAGPSPR